MARCIKTYEEFGNVPRTFQGEKRSLSEHFFLEDARDEPNDLLETAEKTLSAGSAGECSARLCGVRRVLVAGSSHAQPFSCPHLDRLGLV